MIDIDESIIEIEVQRKNVDNLHNVFANTKEIDTTTYDKLSVMLAEANNMLCGIKDEVKKLKG